MDILGQSALIVAITSFSLALTALSRKLRNKLVLQYALLCVVIGFWGGFFFLEKLFVTGGFYRLHLALNVVIAPISLYFMRVLARVDSRFSRALYYIAVLYTIIVVGLLSTALWNESLVRGLAYFAPSFLIFECVHLMLRDFRRKNSGRGRRSWIYMGALVLLGSAAMDHVPRLGDVIPSVGNVLLCLYLFVISEVIIHQRLLNFGALLNRVLVVIFIAMCLTLVYAVSVGWVDNSPGLFVLNTFIASTLAIIAIDPLRKLANIGFMRIFSRKYVEFQKRVEQAQAQLTGVVDSSGLALVVLQFLETGVRAQAATVFILRSDGTKYRRIRGVRDDSLGNREILASHPLAEFFLRLKRRGETPVVLSHYLENEIDRATTQSQRDQLDAVLKGLSGLNANVAIPFLDGGTVLGFVAAQVPNPPEPWGTNWGFLSVTYPLFPHVARTLKNLDVYVRLREKDRLATLGEMAAGLAHEIRNPLGAIKGAAQLLEGEASAADSKSPFLRVIVEEVNRLNKVVTQFLDYSKPSTLQFQKVNVPHLLERSRALFESAKPPGFSLVIDIPETQDFPSVFGDPEQIIQVLVNFFQNSVRAMSKNSEILNPTIKVSTSVVSKALDFTLAPKDYVVISLEDNGPGIPRENVEKIFIPFFTTSPGGTGLGLSICAKIVEAHEGRIEVQSEEGKYARFSVYLPAQKG